MNQSQIEPSADMRVLAANLRQMFLALVREGFTEQQALTIIGQCISANAKGGE